MKNKMFKRKNRRGLRGFTLIELLVVIAIIGILASVVLASLNSARKKSRDSRRVADIEEIRLALELYFDAQSPGAYPTDLAQLVSGGFIGTLPKDPLDGDGATCRGGNYCYAYYDAPHPTYYHLGANLEDDKHVALDSDKDCDSSKTSCPAGAIYTGGFDGTVTTIYDVVP
jgi:prepilin-type N-terminal cleavage/methylation domain-containing protein